MRVGSTEPCSDARPRGMAVTAGASKEAAAAQNPAYRLASHCFRGVGGRWLHSTASMNPDAHTLWRAPKWALAALLACLGMLGPFSSDT